jgi:hypothetical protein
MRWYILRTLLKKECRRHLANSGGVAMAGLLVVASLLLSVFGKSDVQTGNLGGGVDRCFVDFWEPGPWVDYLRDSVPSELSDHVEFRPLHNVPVNAEGKLQYPLGAGAIQIRSGGDRTNQTGYFVQFWHPGGNEAAMAPYEAWFWEQTQAFFQKRMQEGLSGMPSEIGRRLRVPVIRSGRSGLGNKLDFRSGIVTALVIFALFFVCVYLLPSMTCEERERGVLLAQALSPASPREIMAAKFLFYPLVAMALAGVIVGVYRPSVLGVPFFWSALAVSAAGSMGIGLTVASLARSQRTASLGAMCYLFAIALLQFICQQTNLPFLNQVTLEYHCPRMLHAVLTHDVQWYHRWNLFGAAILAFIWAMVATRLFRTRGWQ